MGKKLSPMDILNNVRNKAKLDNNDFSKSIAIRLKPGKIKFQLIAADSDYLFRPRTQHMIPTVPHEEDKNEKWMIADCKGTGCPICAAAESFKKSGVELDDVNEAYNPKFPYKTLRAVFTQPEHYLLCAKVLADNADDGNYLPKDSEIGSTHLIQFPRTALNNLMSAYEDAMDDAEDEEVPPLFAIFEDDNKASSLTITCRVTNQPYSCTFSFGKVVEVEKKDIDEEKLKLLVEAPEVPEEHYAKCVKRIKDIQNYFVKPTASTSYADESDEDDGELPFSMGDEDEKSKTTSSSSKNETEDSEFDINSLL